MGLEGGWVAGPGNSQIRLKLKYKLKRKYKLKLKYELKYQLKRKYKLKLEYKLKYKIKLKYRIKLKYKLTCRGDLLGGGESWAHFACLPEDHFDENKYGQNLTKTTSARCACLAEDQFDEYRYWQIWQEFFLTNMTNFEKHKSTSTCDDLSAWKWLLWRRPRSQYCCWASTVENDKCYKKMRFQVRAAVFGDSSFGTPYPCSRRDCRITKWLQWAVAKTKTKKNTLKQKQSN